MQRNIYSSRLSSNSEANTSELLENLEEMWIKNRRLYIICYPRLLGVKYPLENYKTKTCFLRNESNQLLLVSLTQFNS